MSAGRGHRFSITVQGVDEQHQPTPGREPLNIEVLHHDDLLDIVERVRAGTAFAPAEAAALALGLKLFTGVMLAHRTDPIFEAVRPAMRNFIGHLKSRVEASRPTR